MRVCPGDGVVATHSAKLSASAANIENYDTACMTDPKGGDPAECNVSHWRPPGTQDHDFKRSACVADNVILALRGGHMQACSPPLELVAATAADTLMQPLAPVDHVLAATGSAVDSIPVSAGTYLGVRAHWARGGVALSLQAPDGTVIDSAATLGVPGRLFRSDASGPWAGLEVAGAQAGTWLVRLVANADTVQHVLVSPFVSGDVTLDLAATPPRVAPGGVVTLTAALRRSATPLTGATVQGTITDPAGASQGIVLHDDGTAGDSLAGDGIYSALVTVGGTSGGYRADVTAIGGAGVAYAPRGAAILFVVQPAIDLQLDPVDLSVSATWAYTSDPIVLTAIVRNRGDLAADSVWVHGVDDSTGAAFLDTVVTVPAHGATTVLGAFASPRVGLHAPAIAVADLADTPESNLANNRAAHLVEVVAFGSTPQFVGVPAPPERAPSVYLLTRVAPNPARSGATLQFYLARPEAEVRLAVFDVQGRVLEARALGSRPAGWQSVGLDVGRPGTTGVFFYRIEAGRSVGQGRFVLLR